MSELVRLQEEIRRRDGAVPAMLPAAAYTSEEVLAWERRHLFAGGWTCLGRLDELLPAALEDDGKPATQRALLVGDVAALLTRSSGTVRMFANTCRHRAHELLPDGDASARRAVTCPYHAWSYDLGGDLIAAPGYRDEPGFESAAYSLVELPVAVWQGWVFGHAAHRLGDPDVVPF
jgi:Rieske 2Fe-2S family protein